MRRTVEGGGGILPPLLQPNSQSDHSRADRRSFGFRFEQRRQDAASPWGRFAITLLILTALSCQHLPADTGRAPQAFTDLPLIEKHVESNSPEMAVLLTGDGGWRRIDIQLTKYLNRAGVPVVGIDSPAYFSRRRTPEEAARDLDRVISHYMDRWKKNRVLLIGYSRGADVLPFLASRLPAETYQRVGVIALLGLEDRIEFRFVPRWKSVLSHTEEPTYAVAPEVEKLAGSEILCVYGKSDRNSLCQHLRPGLAKLIEEPGGHHFSGDYSGIAEKILAAARSGPVRRLPGGRAAGILPAAPR